MNLADGTAIARRSFSHRVLTTLLTGCCYVRRCDAHRPGGYCFMRDVAVRMLYVLALMASGFGAPLAAQSSQSQSGTSEAMAAQPDAADARATPAVAPDADEQIVQKPAGAPPTP